MTESPALRIARLHEESERLDQAILDLDPADSLYWEAIAHRDAIQATIALLRKV